MAPMDLSERQRRRELRRRQIRRRRLTALGGLVAVAAAVAAVVALGSGSSRPDQASASARSPRTGAKRGDGGAGAKKTPAKAIVHGPPGHEPVPILMYHVIAAPPADAPFPGLYVQPQEFAEQMQALKQAGWHAVTLDQVLAYWRQGVPLGAGKPIVLSFDNGYQSQYTQALPVLEKLGWVGDENLQLTGLPPSQGGLGQEEIKGLVKAGWELDTQGFSHADLITLDAQELHYQVAVARAVVRKRYHVPVNWFCYPSGHYDPTVEAAVKAAGYVGSTTVVPGWADPADDLYRLPRLRVLGGTSGAQLLSEIAGIREDAPAPETYTGA